MEESQTLFNTVSLETNLAGNLWVPVPHSCSFSSTAVGRMKERPSGLKTIWLQDILRHSSLTTLGKIRKLRTKSQSMNKKDVLFCFFFLYDSGSTFFKLNSNWAKVRSLKRILYKLYLSPYICLNLISLCELGFPVYWWVPLRNTNCSHILHRNW